MNALRFWEATAGRWRIGGVTPGAAVTLRSILPVGVDASDHSPDGTTHQLTREGQNAFVFTRTDRLGVFPGPRTWRQNASQQFAVNLFDPRKSDLTPRTEIKLGYELVAGSSSTNRLDASSGSG